MQSNQEEYTTLDVWKHYGLMNEQTIKECNEHTIKHWNDYAKRIKEQYDEGEKEQDYIYVIAMGDPQDMHEDKDIYYKIGLSNNPQSRLTKMKNGNPMPLNFVYIQPLKAGLNRYWAHRIETKIHRLVGSHYAFRVKGRKEWYNGKFWILHEEIFALDAPYNGQNDIFKEHFAYFNKK